MAETLLLIAVQDQPEAEEAQDCPDHKQEKGFGRHETGAEKAGDQQRYEENGHPPDAGAARPELRPVLALPGQPHRGRGDKSIDQHRAEDRHMDDPADHGPAQEGNPHGNPGDQHDRFRRHIPAVQFPETRGQDSVPAQRVKQAAQGGDGADHAHDHHRQQGNRQDCRARGSQETVRRIEGGEGFDAFQMIQVPDIFLPGSIPGRISGSGQQRDADAQQRNGQQGQRQDAEGF